MAVSKDHINLIVDSAPLTKREAHILHLNENIYDAREKVRDAMDQLNTRSPGDSEFIEDFQKVGQAEAELLEAENALEETGEVVPVIPDLAPIVVF